jgi:outer membrane protein TolC
MSFDDLRVLLDAVPDTREIVLRRGERWSAVHDAWREAHEEAAEAYRAWRAGRTRTAYVAYRAAQDREDAAQDQLAGAR